MANVTAEATEVSPYLHAWRWIERNPGTGSAKSLAKLLLSLWNHSNAFSFRECIDNLDNERLQLAVRMATYFAQHGEDRELIELGYKVADAYPRLFEVGQGAWEAKRALYEKWRIDDAKAEALKTGV
jgi:hypothetical protein